MDDDTDLARPPIKRSKSDHGSILPIPPLDDNLVVGDGSPLSSAASAPCRIEGQLEDDDISELEEDFPDASSVFEDILDMAEERPFVVADDDEDAPEGFTLEQGQVIRARLREIGAESFIEEYIMTGKYSPRHLITAFGVRPDLDIPDTVYGRILGLSIQKELDKRQKLAEYNNLDDAVALLKRSKNILVITGAGISTSLGIPDFRSKHTGFYSRLREQGFHEPEQVFDLHEFDDDPSIFYNLAAEILPVTDRCSATHAFIKLLQDQGKLLTNYTQNIDNIEQIAGIEPDKLIQCHGSWATASCRKCGDTVPGSAIFEDVLAQRVARCKVCVPRLAVPQSKKRKREGWNNSKSRGKGGYSDEENDGEFDVPEPGVMKPGITFFYEKLPDKFFTRFLEHDKDLTDLVIVIGTSMKVSPVSQVPNSVPSNVPHIYISREPVKHINFDIQLLGYCDDVVSELSRRAGWTIGHADFDVAAEAVIGQPEPDADHLWAVRIPGREHTVQETANPEG